MRFGLCLSAAVLLLWSCATTSAPVPVPPAEPSSVPAAEPSAPPEAPAVPVADPVLPGEFQVSVEKKNASLKEIRDLVDRLNALIAKKAFAEWKTYLDEDYVTLYSSKAKLAEFSRPPYVRKGDSPLKTLQDFFNNVVVLSRAEVTVDDISFVDENRVKVLTVIDGDKVVLYLLKFSGKEWKISSW